MTTQAPTPDQIRDAWDAIAPGFDEFATPQSIGIGEMAIRTVGIQPGARFLDVAAGSGALSIPAARMGADVVATDIAPTMIDRLAARARAEGLPNVEARVMDGQALDVPDDTFDVSASQFGVSLFPDPRGGLAELVRVTKPGGTVLVVAGGTLPKTEFFAFFLAAFRVAVPSFTPPTEEPLPFQLADPDVFHRFLTDAGLSGVTVNTITWDTRFESATHLWSFVTSGNPIGAQLVADLTAEQRSGVKQALDGMLRERSGGEPGAVLHGGLNVGIGTK